MTSFRWLQSDDFIQMKSLRWSHSDDFIQMTSFRWLHSDDFIQMKSFRWSHSAGEFMNSFTWLQSDGLDGFYYFFAAPRAPPFQCHNQPRYSLRFTRLWHWDGGRGGEKRQESTWFLPNLYVIFWTRTRQFSHPTFVGCENWRLQPPPTPIKIWNSTQKF